MGLKDSRFVQRLLKQIGNTPPEGETITKEAEIEKEYVPYGVTTFEQLEETRIAQEKAMATYSMTDDYMQMIWNIMYSEEITDKTAALKRLSNEFAKRLPEAGDTEKSLPEQVLNAIDRVENNGLGMMVWKEANTDNYRWLAIYSNNFEDRDTPSDIISKEAHLRYIDRVEKGKALLPTARSWHLPLDYGQADNVFWADFDKETGFIVATGYFLKGFEAVAESLSKSKNIAVSFGGKNVVRDSQNPRVVLDYDAFEISDLPDWAAANEFTQFVTIDKETEDMAIPDLKKQYLGERGFTDAQIAQLEKNLDNLGQSAMSKNLVYKEIEEMTLADLERLTRPIVIKEETPAPAPAPAPAGDYITRAEFDEAMLAIGKGMQGEIVELQETVKELSDIIALQSGLDLEKEVEIQDLPHASANARLLKEIFNNPADTEDALRYSHPRQAETQKSRGKTGIDFLDELMADDK